jgi:tetratricopeptide (TPR) repeat protein
MQRVVTAIETGRCALAVSSSLLNDADVVLALKDRASVPAIALSGLPVAPTVPVTEAALARATGQAGGVIVLVSPQQADMPAIKAISDIVGRAPHKPAVIVAAHQFNPFQFAGLFKGISVAHVKARGKDFFRDLPLPTAMAEVELEATPKAAKVAKAGSGPDAPRFAFVGRDEELAALKGMLEEGGPIVVSGPAGVGKTWLVEHAIAASGLQRLPDLVLGWGTDADALLGRIAAIGKAHGNGALETLLSGPHTPIQAVSAAIEVLQGCSGAAGQVMVIADLHSALGRSNDFFRKSRVELMLEALLTHTYPLCIVFTSRSQPVFHRERAGEHLRRLPIAGIKGRFFHEVFDAYKAPEFPRDKFGPMSEKLHGHPMAARAFAIEVRDRPNGLELLDDAKFLAMDDAEDLSALRKLYERKVEKLDADDRQALAVCAHFRLPITGQMLSDIGIGRKQRLQLLADGLLDMVGTAEDKRYAVHSLVRSALSMRETSDFDMHERIGQLYARLSTAAEGLEKFALAQEANRQFLSAHRPASALKIGVPDDDAKLEAVAGMIRSKKPNFDTAAKILRDVLAANPANSDAWLLKIEGMSRSQADGDAVQAQIDESVEKAPVPEVFQQAVSFHLGRRARGKATTVLEKGVELLPDHSRLRTRLASLLLRQGRRKEAIENLKQAMELDPMLPDAYGLLGNARRDEGLESLPEAESLLREAVRLAPEDAVQISRLVDLLLARARLDVAHQKALREESKELLDRILRHDGDRAPDALVLLATLLREEGGDLERCTWLLKKARKATERGEFRHAWISVEQALVALQRGELDEAERDIRDLAAKEPSNDRVFAALAAILEARQLYIPAHAEYLRAQERAPQGSLERAVYDQHLARLQALIEAQVAGMVGGEASSLPEMEAESATGHQRVIRRRKTEAEEAAPAEEANEGDTAAS